MYTAEEARKMIRKEDAINECKRRIEERINKAIKDGSNEISFTDTGCYLDGRYIDCEYELKKWLTNLGYRIEPMGYAYGVWNDVDLIKW